MLRTMNKFINVASTLDIIAIALLSISCCAFDVRHHSASILHQQPLTAIAIAVLSIHIIYGTLSSLSSALMLFLPYCVFDAQPLSALIDVVIVASFNKNADNFETIMTILILYYPPFGYLSPPHA